MTNPTNPVSVINLSDVYPSKIDYKSSLTSLSPPKFGRFAIVNRDGSLGEATIIGYLIAKIASLWPGTVDRTNTHLISLRFMQTVEFGAEQGWITAEDQKLFESIVDRCGIIPKGDFSKTSSVQEYLKDVFSNLKQLSSQDQETIKQTRERLNDYCKIHKLNELPGNIIHTTFPAFKELEKAYTSISQKSNQEESDETSKQTLSEDDEQKETNSETANEQQQRNDPSFESKNKETSEESLVYLPSSSISLPESEAHKDVSIIEETAPSETNGLENRPTTDDTSSSKIKWLALGIIGIFGASYAAYAFSRNPVVITHADGSSQTNGAIDTFQKLADTSSRDVEIINFFPSDHPDDPSLLNTPVDKLSLVQQQNQSDAISFSNASLEYSKKEDISSFEETEEATGIKNTPWNIYHLVTAGGFFGLLLWLSWRSRNQTGESLLEASTSSPKELIKQDPFSVQEGSPETNKEQTSPNSGSGNEEQPTRIQDSATKEQPEKVEKTPTIKSEPLLTPGPQAVEAAAQIANEYYLTGCLFLKMAEGEAQALEYFGKAIEKCNEIESSVYLSLAEYCKDTAEKAIARDCEDTNLTEKEESNLLRAIFQMLHIFAVKGTDGHVIDTTGDRTPAKLTSYLQQLIKKDDRALDWQAWLINQLYQDTQAADEGTRLNANMLLSTLFSFQKLPLHEKIKTALAPLGVLCEKENEQEICEEINEENGSSEYPTNTSLITQQPSDAIIPHNAIQQLSSLPTTHATGVLQYPIDLWTELKGKELSPQQIEALEKKRKIEKGRKEKLATHIDKVKKAFQAIEIALFFGDYSEITKRYKKACQDNSKTLAQLKKQDSELATMYEKEIEKIYNNFSNQLLDVGKRLVEKGKQDYSITHFDNFKLLFPVNTDMKEVKVLHEEILGFQQECYQSAVTGYQHLMEKDRDLQPAEAKTEWLQVANNLKQATAFADGEKLTEICLMLGHSYKRLYELEDLSYNFYNKTKAIYWYFMGALKQGEPNSENSMKIIESLLDKEPPKVLMNTEEKEISFIDLGSLFKNLRQKNIASKKDLLKYFDTTYPHLSGSFLLECMYEQEKTPEAAVVLGGYRLVEMRDANEKCKKSGIDLLEKAAPYCLEVVPIIEHYVKEIKGQQTAELVNEIFGEHATRLSQKCMFYLNWSAKADQGTPEESIYWMTRITRLGHDTFLSDLKEIAEDFRPVNLHRELAALYLDYLKTKQKDSLGLDLERSQRLIELDHGFLKYLKTSKKPASQKMLELIQANEPSKRALIAS